jgi:MFS family permease
MPGTITGRPTRVRYLVLAALAAGAVLSYLLRVCISPAGTTIQAELGISDVAMGDIYAAFFLGYFWFQLPGGWVGNRFGARASLALMGLLWAAATALASRSHSDSLLFWSRAALGVAQAGLFPVTIMAVRDWFPGGRHGLASSVVTACMSAGAVLASALTTRLLAVFGWRETFLIYGLLAAAWAAAFLAWFRDRPEHHPGVNSAELRLIRSPGSDLTPVQEGRAGRWPSTSAVLLGMLASTGMWALCSQAFFQAFGYAVFITWFPAYLEKGRGLSPTRAGDLTTLPLVTITVGSVVGGYLIDLVLKTTGRRWLSRSGLPSAALALGALCTAAAAWVGRPGPAVVVIAAGLFFTGIAMPGKWACTIDLAAGHTATVFAIMNMSGNIGAWICPKVVGRLFQALEGSGGDWSPFLFLIAGVLLAASLCCLALNPNRPAVVGGTPPDPGRQAGS